MVPRNRQNNSSHFNFPNPTDEFDGENLPKTKLEPIDNEDNPNLLVECGNFESSRKNNENLPTMQVFRSAGAKLIETQKVESFSAKNPEKVQREASTDELIKNMK